MQTLAGRTAQIRPAPTPGTGGLSGPGLIGGPDDLGARLPLPPIGPADIRALDDRPLIEERDLLDRMRRGDDSAFACLFERHWSGVHRLLARLLGDYDAAGDQAQEVFVQLYRRPPDGDVVPLRAWLYRVAINRGYNVLRTDRRRRSREDAVARDPGAGAMAAAGFGASAADVALIEATNQAEERDTVRRALLTLPARQRDCLVLRSEGLSYAEVAAALGVASGSVGTLLVRAERAFRAAFLAQRGGM